MSNRTLTSNELQLARELLAEIRARIETLAAIRRHDAAGCDLGNHFCPSQRSAKLSASGAYRRSSVTTQTAVLYKTWKRSRTKMNWLGWTVTL